MKLERGELALLLGALLIGLLVRLPGVWWGSNFPYGWYGHHPDEYTHALHSQLLINPRQPKVDPDTSSRIGLHDPWSAGFSVTPYPVALAIHISTPIIAMRVFKGIVNDPPPKPSVIIPLGRLVSVAYGVATILIVFFLAWEIFKNKSIAILSAWLMAFGGLHITQSHFFLSDVPALFWFLSGLLFLWKDLGSTKDVKSAHLAIAALCMGAAFGMKLFITGILPLGIAAIFKVDRLWRVTLTAVFFLFGMTAINGGMFTPVDFYKVLFRGISDPYEFSIVSSIFLYIVELPSIISIPLFIASLIGIPMLGIRYFRISSVELKVRLAIVFLLPLFIHVFLVLFVLDHFPRHLIPFIPFLLIVSAWLMVTYVDRVVSGVRVIKVTVYVIVLIYLGVFVYDAEKGFIMDPRNKVAEWLNQHVAKGSTVWWYYHAPLDYKRSFFPSDRPDVVVEEMIHANHYLSGMGLKNSMPRDYRRIFDSHSQEYVDTFQALFTNKSEYSRVVSFSEGYFMPEFTLTERLIGNRSRNYLTEVVIFMRKESEKPE